MKVYVYISLYIQKHTHVIYARVKYVMQECGSPVYVNKIANGVVCAAVHGTRINLI